MFSIGCRERDSNPHDHHWPRDFKSLVSTNSTIAAIFHIARYLAASQHKASFLRSACTSIAAVHCVSKVRYLAAPQHKTFLHRLHDSGRHGGLPLPLRGANRAF